MVKRFDHSPTIIRKNIFDRSYRIRREQSLSRRFIVIHISPLPSIFPVPIFLFLRRVTLSPIAQRGQTITKVRFIPEGKGRKKKRIRDTHPVDGIFELETTRHVEYTGSGGAVPSSSRRLLVEHHRFSFSFFHSSFLSLPLFLLFFSPQHPCSFWDTHYRCSSHVISESLAI